MSNIPNSQEMSAEDQALVAQIVNEKGGYAKFVRALFNRSGDPSKDFTHAVLGIVTETQELLDAKTHLNSVEEAGDLVFYAEALDQVITDHLGKVLGSPEVLVALEAIPLNSMNSADAIAYLRNEVLDMAKRWVGYGREPNFALAVGMCVQLINFAVEASIMRGEPNEREVVVCNVAKLIQRYKGTTFNAEHAVNRDTAAEARVMSEHVADA